MKFHALLSFAALVFFSCGEGLQKENTVLVQDTTKIQDTIIVKDSILNSSLADSVPTGAFQGIFPCTDCDGIQQTILFNNDKTFKEEQMIWSKNESPKMSTGNWQRKNGRIILSQNNTPVMELIKKEDTLFAVNINGVIINNSSKYALIKRPLAGASPLWDKKRLQGINFAASGNEPFWSLEIDYEKFISFKLADWKKPVITGIEKPVLNKDSIFYKLKTDTTKWSITIFPQFCNDGMSDYLYQYKVNVNYNGILYKGCGIMLSKKNYQ